MSHRRGRGDRRRCDLSYDGERPDRAAAGTGGGEGRGGGEGAPGPLCRIPVGRLSRPHVCGRACGGRGGQYRGDAAGLLARHGPLPRVLRHPAGLFAGRGVCPARGEGGRFGGHHFARRLYRHQPPCGGECHRTEGEALRRTHLPGRGGRYRSHHGGGAHPYRGREPAHAGLRRLRRVAARGVGAGHRQSVRPAIHHHGGHRERQVA